MFRSGPLRGSVLALEKERTSIGRDAKNDVAIKDDIVSSFHAAIIYDGEKFWLEDLGSKNGTFVDGKRIQRVELKDRAVFCLCQAGLEVEFTVGTPRLPTVVESTTGTFSRTRSLRSALRELLPGKAAGASQLLSLTGVRRIFDYKLEESARRSRVVFLATAAAFVVVCVGLLGTMVYFGTRLLDRQGQNGQVAAGASMDIEPWPELELSIQPIYGSQFLSYRETPIARATVRNVRKEAIEGLRLGFRFDGTTPGVENFLLTEPWSVPLEALQPGEAREVKIAPKLSADLVSDETREVTATIFILAEGKEVARSSRGVFIHGRNVFTWEDPLRVAVFVDPNAPAVRELVRLLWEHKPTRSSAEFPPSNLLGALTLLSGLGSLELKYLPDSTNPLSERIDTRANDRVSYSGETLADGQGDCDDLTVLTCAVLEAARIPAAIVVGDGHVFPMFDSGIETQAVEELGLDSKRVVLRGGHVWIPIEATELARPGNTFSSAWAAAWPNVPAISSGASLVVEVEEAWRSFPPMTLSRSAPSPERLAALARAKDRLDDRIASEIETIEKVFREHIARQAKEINDSEEAGPYRDQLLSRLYASCGFLRDARELLEKAIFGEHGAPSLPLAVGAPDIDEDHAFLLTDLAVCISLGARSPEDLERAARYGEWAIESLKSLPDRDRGELMLRVGLIHRLRGDVVAESAWVERATRLDASLATVYARLEQAGGPVAGAPEALLRHLRSALSTPVVKR